MPAKERLAIIRVVSAMSALRLLILRKRRNSGHAGTAESCPWRSSAAYSITLSTGRATSISWCNPGEQSESNFVGSSKAGLAQHPHSAGPCHCPGLGGAHEKSLLAVAFAATLAAIGSSTAQV